MNNLGYAGEFYVAAELTKRGFIATLTSKNTKTIDILVSNQEGSKLRSIQVKTSKNKNEFFLNKSDENIPDNENLYYIFVNLNIKENKNKLEYGEIEYYCVPMKQVKEYIIKEHNYWLNSPNRHGEIHNDNNIRKYRIQQNDIKNDFSKLNLN